MSLYPFSRPAGSENPLLVFSLHYGYFATAGDDIMVRNWGQRTFDGVSRGRSRR